jgi:hypothetical protein
MNDRSIVVASDGGAVAHETVRRAAALADALSMSLHVVVPRGATVRFANRLPKARVDVTLHEAEGDLTLAAWDVATSIRGDFLVLRAGGARNPLRRLAGRLGRRMAKVAEFTLEVVDVEAFAPSALRAGQSMARAEIRVAAP